MNNANHKSRSTNVRHAALFTVSALGGLATGVSLAFLIWNLI